MSTSLIKAKSSLLFLTQTLADLKTNLKYLLEESFKKTNENLYIYINPIRKQEDSVTNYKSSSLKITYLCNERYQLKLILNQFYQSSFKLNPNINVTCLLSNIHTYSNKASRHQLDYDLILTDWLIRPDQGDDLKLTQFLNTKITNLNQKEIPINSIDCNENKNPRATVWPNETPSDHDELFKNGTFENSIMGGTFDRIHNGHKIMLSEAVLLTRNRLLIGMTSESMLKKKKLAELIQSFDVRCENLKKFLKDVNPDLEVLTPMLMDPFGPSIVEPDYQCLIVSRETFKSGEMLNTKRLENHLSELKIHVVELMSENKEGENDDGDEDKISSSNERRRLLGTLLRPPYISYNPSKPYVIGLTGGLASGKSAIRGDLEKLGAGTIDCDKLGHRTYEIGTPAYIKIIETFGKEILDETTLGIDRKRLGEKVFKKPEELKKLTDIVWPEIRNLLDKEVESLFLQGKKIIVVEAALLLDANWNSNMNEVWVCFVPDEEAIERSARRDNANLEKIKAILSSQMSNMERIKKANVVFSSLWERDYTLKQVKKAWNFLHERLNSKL